MDTITYASPARELMSAMILPITGKTPGMNVYGNLGAWELDRKWHYWEAVAPPGKGLSLTNATVLHETPREDGEVYGNVIRPQGSMDDNLPSHHVKLFDLDGNEFVLDKTGELEARMKKYFSENKQFCGWPEFDKFRNRVYVQNVDEIDDYIATIDMYHILSLEGLRKFAHTVREIETHTQLLREMQNKSCQ